MKKYIGRVWPYENLIIENKSKDDCMSYHGLELY